MAAAVIASPTFYEATQLFGTKFVHCVATSTENDDWISVTPLTLVRGVVSNYATDGTAGTHTITGTSALVTLTNGGTKIWHVLVYGD